ncbi:hypothetical protein KUTeg_018897 [Tegillarca granosa]|uniref:Tyrosinase copper-binding domain-containing protein n=1 Tax=Tegillarca granosa TaxID=220873 RepID=A0ABQ9EF69_TEGGR|nr:hypothetical protein KUTeg_018897 [Tegillarca granosa]
MQKIIILLLVTLHLTSGAIKEIKLNPKLQKCLDDQKAKYKMVGNAVGYNLYETCINMYVTSLLRRSMTDVTPRQKAYIRGLLGEVIGRNGRIKRQARRRIRNEIRQMTDRQRETYNNAVIALKRQFPDPRDSRSSYDVIADRHRGVLELAHNGPVFPGWHRIYLLMYEQALRRIDRSVTVPYYASHLDDAMGQQERSQSVVWSDRFFGNCDGQVITGPFRNFATPNGPLRRDCALFGAPISYEAIDNIMSNTLNAHIFLPNARFDSSLEDHHNMLHVYIGGGTGQVSRLDFAPYDPCFFNLHAHVDKIWYDFQVRRSATDYPPFRNPIHAPNARVGFGNLTNRDSYTDITRIYTYSSLPQDCSRCEESSPYYTCNRQTQQCRSLSISEARFVQPRQTTDVTTEPSTNSNFSQPRKKRQSPIADIIKNQDIEELFKQNVIETPKQCGDSVLKRSMQNSFYIDGFIDSNKWVYVALEVIYNRAPEKTTYNSFPVHNGARSTKYDIYSPYMLPKLTSEIRPGKPRGFKGCENPSMNAAMIFIGSHGLNYYGDYKEYVVADKRMAISSTIGYVAVKSPEINGTTEAIISVHDACGRICKAYCYIPGSNSEYRRCNGAIQLTKDEPKMYGKNIAECVEGMWNFSKMGFCPKSVKSDVFLKFYCDYKDDWPWETGVQTANPTPLTTSEPSTEEHVENAMKMKSMLVSKETGSSPNVHPENFQYISAIKISIITGVQNYVPIFTLKEDSLVEYKKEIDKKGTSKIMIISIKYSTTNCEISLSIERPQLIALALSVAEVIIIVSYISHTDDSLFIEQNMFRVLLFLTVLQYGVAKITEMDLPPAIEQCLNKQRQKFDIKRAVGLYMYDSCVNMYICKLVSKHVKKASPENQRYVNHLINKVFHRDGRVKRQTGGVRTRYEIRQLSPRQLDRYHRAVNTLKESGRYDAIAELHRGHLIPQVHIGPAFAAWHRIYLILYETALMEIDSSVTVPYYASQLDDEIGRFERLQSPVWTETFFGNCDGFVTTGPFANWRTPRGRLLRDCGLLGAPYNNDDIERVMNKRLNSEIFHPSASFDDNMEIMHDSVHGYIGGGNGDISRLDNAPHDPVFWNHHAMVDKIWYEFRLRQRNRGMGTPDYPPNEDTNGQNENDPVLFGEDPNSSLASLLRQATGGLTYRDAYQDNIFEGVYRYSELPTCRSGCESNSPYYTCGDEVRGYCRSLTATEAEGLSAGGRGNSSRGRSGGRTVTEGGFRDRGRDSGRSTDPLPWWLQDNVSHGRFKRQTTRHNSVRTTPNEPCSGSLTERSMQNSFYIDGKVDSGKWVYIATEVVYSRPPEKKVYYSFPLKNDRASHKYDIYSYHNNNNLERKLSQGHPKTYSHCETPHSNAAMIFVGSEGLNYYGNYKEYVVADKRLAVSSSKGYVAVKSPEKSDTEVMINAHDSCGRVCKAYCQVPGSKTLYRRCNGALRITRDTPKMYGSTIAECLNDMWNLDNNGYCPSVTERGVFIKFFCDYKDDWPFMNNSSHTGNSGSSFRRNNVTSIKSVLSEDHADLVIMVKNIYAVSQQMYTLSVWKEDSGFSGAFQNFTLISIGKCVDVTDQTPGGPVINC